MMFSKRSELFFSGTGVLPSARVKITVCVKFGTVNSTCAAAAAANAELTPGTISTSIPSFSKEQFVPTSLHKSTDRLYEAARQRVLSLLLHT